MVSCKCASLGGMWSDRFMDFMDLRGHVSVGVCVCPCRDVGESLSACECGFYVLRRCELCLGLCDVHVCRIEVEHILCLTDIERRVFLVWSGALSPECIARMSSFRYVAACVRSGWTCKHCLGFVGFLRVLRCLVSR